MFPWRSTTPHKHVAQASLKEGLLITEVLGAASGHGDHAENIRRQAPVASVSRVISSFYVHEVFC